MSADPETGQGELRSDRDDRLVAGLDVVVQFSDGLVWISVGRTGQIASAEDGSLLQTLTAFIAPRSLEQVIAAAADPAAARAQVDQLRTLGALVPAQEVAPASEPPEQLVQRYLVPFTRATDQLAGAIRAIGPEVAEAIRRETGLSLEARLKIAEAGLLSAQAAIAARAGTWVRQQLRALDLPLDDLSIQIGAGGECPPGWVNIDLWPAPLSMDFRWGLPFADGSAARVYASHVLEHAFYPDEALELLREVRRVLRPGGRVRIVVPDIEACIAAYQANDTAFFAGREAYWPEWKMETRLESFLGFAGAGPYPGLFGDAHKWGYDYETLAYLLNRAGFAGVERGRYDHSADPALNLDRASAWAGAQVDGRFYSLFVEART